jgi:hypothetical protein
MGYEEVLIETKEKGIGKGEAMHFSEGVHGA